MSALPEFKEPDPLSAPEVLRNVMEVMRGPDDAEAYGFDAIEFTNGGFAVLAAMRQEVCIALISPFSPQAQEVRDALLQKWIRMAEDAEWSPT
jgi:hypothetical protein